MIKAHATVTLTLITIFGNTALTCCGCIACNRKKKKQKQIHIKVKKENNIEKTTTVSQRVKGIITQSKRLFTTRAYIHFLLGTAAT